MVVHILQGNVLKQSLNYNIVLIILLLNTDILRFIISFDLVTHNKLYPSLSGLEIYC